MIKFISYDGEWPNLCRGTLVLEYEGKTYSLNHILISGGSCGFYGDFEESYIETDSWEIDKDELPDELKPFVKEIKDLINENISWGCCGGCL